MTTSVIVAGARTPIGRLQGGLKTLSGSDLGGVAIKGALDRAGINGDQVDYDGYSGPVTFDENGDPTEATIGIYEFGADNKYTRVN